MSLQNDLAIVQSGINKLTDLMMLPENKESVAAFLVFQRNELKPTVDAGFRVISSLFTNLERLANTSEERLNHDAR